MVSNEKKCLDLSLGGVTWWGFSPWTVLQGQKVLIIGAGDPRHIVKTIAKFSDNLEMFVFEQNLQVYCRQVSM